MKKLIDKETLKTIVWRAYNTEGPCGNCVNCPDTCPIWNSLPDVPESDQSKDTERLKPTWLEYEGY